MGQKQNLERRRVEEIELTLAKLNRPENQNIRNVSRRNLLHTKVIKMFPNEPRTTDRITWFKKQINICHQCNWSVLSHAHACKTIAKHPQNISKKHPKSIKKSSKMESQAPPVPSLSPKRLQVRFLMDFWSTQGSIWEPRESQKDTTTTNKCHARPLSENSPGK